MWKVSSKEKTWRVKGRRCSRSSGTSTRACETVSSLLFQNLHTNSHSVIVNPMQPRSFPLPFSSHSSIAANIPPLKISNSATITQTLISSPNPPSPL
ncbi:hypothetical protein ACSQ67_006237 [Phaseolus vulgaris]